MTPRFDLHDDGRPNEAFKLLAGGSESSGSGEA